LKVRNGFLRETECTEKEKELYPFFVAVKKRGGRENIYRSGRQVGGSKHYKYRKPSAPFSKYYK
jgi:hypothetical protein